MPAPQNPDLPAAGSFSSSAAPLPQPSTPSPAQLQESVNELRRVFRISTAALVLFLLVMNIFLYHQARIVRKQAADWNLQVQEMQRAVSEYRTNSGPYMLRVSSELYRYADTHPDFAAVIARYPRPTSAPPAVAKPAGSLAPVPAPAPAPRAAAPPTKR